MTSPEDTSKPKEQFLSPDEIRQTIAIMYTKRSESIQERGHELLSILIKELKDNFPLADVEASPFWHAMVMCSEKHLDYIPDEDNVQAINKRIQQFILEKIKPLVDVETDYVPSDLLQSIRDIKTKIFNNGDSGLGERYQSEVNDLVLTLQKECPFSLTKIPEIDAVIGGSGNPESLSALDQDELARVLKKFITLYEPIHTKFLRYLARA